jgi:hypothetical protein
VASACVPVRAVERDSGGVPNAVAPPGEDAAMSSTCPGVRAAFGGAASRFAREGAGRLAPARGLGPGSGSGSGSFRRGLRTPPRMTFPPTPPLTVRGTCRFIIFASEAKLVRFPVAEGVAGRPATRYRRGRASPAPVYGPVYGPVVLPDPSRGRPQLTIFSRDLH